MSNSVVECFTFFARGRVFREIHVLNDEIKTTLLQFRDTFFRASCAIALNVIN